MNRRLPIVLAVLALVVPAQTACAADTPPACASTAAGCPDDEDGIELDDFICEPDDRPDEWECRHDDGRVVITHGPPPRAVIRTPKGYTPPKQPIRQPDSQTRRDIQRNNPAPQYKPPVIRR